MSSIKTKDFLWNGLPAVFYKNKYIIFSPYKKRIVTLKEEELFKKEIYDKLAELGFFGSRYSLDDDTLYITFYTTSMCNLKCIYCFDDKLDGCKSNCFKEQNMSPEFAVKALKKVFENYHKIFAKDKLKLYIHFFGGEPTLNFKTIKAVVEFLEKEKIDAKYQISTNLIADVDKIRYLISKNFRFDISCDGRPEINDRQRPFKAQTKLKPSKILEERIKFLVKEKARIRTKVVVTNDSITEMPNAVKYLAGLGVDHIRLEAVLIDGRAKNSKFVNIKKFNDYFLKAADVASKLSKKYGKKIYISNWAIRNLFTPKDYFCNVVRGNRILIMPDGTIAKCVRNMHSDMNSPFVVGKVDDNNLYLNKKKMQILQNLSVDKMQKCKDCFAKYICSGGCYNENLQDTGSMLIPSKNKCMLAKTLVRKLIIRMYEKNKN